MFVGFAIDSPGTTIVDDAVWVDRIPSGWRVRVAFPRLSRVVPMDGEVDEAIRGAEGQMRGNRICDLVGPYGTDLISLDTFGLKDVFVVTVDVSRVDFVCSPPRVARTTFRSLGCLDYDTAKAAYDDDGHPLYVPLRNMVDVAQGLSRARCGGISKGNLVSIAVAELMLQTNAALADALAAAGYPLVYYNVPVSPEGTSAYADRPLGARDAMGFDRYARFTSPLRRYPDLVNQRLLEDALDGSPPRYAPGSIGRIARRMNQNPVPRAEAEAQVAQHPKVKMGPTMKAVVADPEVAASVLARAAADPSFAHLVLDYGRVAWGWIVEFDAVSETVAGTTAHGVGANVLIPGRPSRRTSRSWAGRLTQARGLAAVAALEIAVAGIRGEPEPAAEPEATREESLVLACEAMGWEAPAFVVTTDGGMFRCRAYVPGFEKTLAFAATAADATKAREAAVEGLADVLADALAGIAGRSLEVSRAT